MCARHTLEGGSLGTKYELNEGTKGVWTPYTSPRHRQSSRTAFHFERETKAAALQCQTRIQTSLLDQHVNLRSASTAKLTTVSMRCRMSSISVYLLLLCLGESVLCCQQLWHVTTSTIAQPSSSILHTSMLETRNHVQCPAFACVKDQFGFASLRGLHSTNQAVFICSSTSVMNMYSTQQQQQHTSPHI